MAPPASNINFTAEDVASKFADEIKGKNVIITGGSPGGLAAEAARVIAKHANLVVLTGRSQNKLDATVEAIKKDTPNANLRTLIMDQHSFTSVRKAAAEVNAYPETINILINSAAVMAMPNYTISSDGLESHLQTNHLSHFLFTSLIFPRIVASTSPSSPARIVNISSYGHNFSDFRFDDYNFSNGAKYVPWEGYGQSKTANIHFTNEIARRAKEKGLNIQSFSVHPGEIDTPLARYVLENKENLIAQKMMNEAGEWLIPLLTVGQGAAGYMVAAFDPSIASQSSSYIAEGKVTTEHRAAYTYSHENGVRLWELSEKLVGQKFDL